MFETVLRPKIRDVMATRLKAYIIERGLKPGDRLPTETELAAQFGVSRLSLREATKALEFLGVLSAKPGRGLVVGQVDLDRVTEYLGFHPTFQNAPPIQLIETRMVIETGVLPYVITRMESDPVVYEELDEINSQLRKARDLSRRVEFDIAFHRRLVESSGLSPLLAFSDLLAVFFQRFRESARHADWNGGVEQHQRLIDALKQGQLNVACEELRTHIQFHKEGRPVEPRL